MSAPGPRRRLANRRLGRVALLSTLVLGAAAFACNSIANLDDIKYSPDPLLSPDGALPDGGTTSPDADRKGRDSSFEATIFPALEFDAMPLGQCEGGIDNSEAVCDHNAGVGCCIRPTTFDSQCMHQLDFDKHCLAAGSSIFVACTRSIDGNECCWRTEPSSQRKFAVYSKSCKELSAQMVCTVSEDCPVGETCNFPTTFCHEDIKFGLCGLDGGPGPECPR